MNTSPSDADLIAASLDEPGRFGAIFERHYDRIYRYLSRRAGPDAAQELAAQTFEEALRHRSRYDLQHEGAAPWLFGIASNLLAHHARSQRVRFDAYAKVASQAPETVDPSDAALDAIVMLPLVAEALRDLPGGDRDALLLYAWADLSYAQIADALQIPVGTVRSRINRVRRGLRELLGEIEATGDEEENR